jgi:hypothetical protein
MHKEGAHDMAGLVTFLEVPDETGDLPLPDLMVPTSQYKRAVTDEIYGQLLHHSHSYATH